MNRAAVARGKPAARQPAEPVAEAKLVVQDVSKAYGKRPAVSDVSFALPAGVTALLGPNGAGKTTLMRCIAGLLDWDSGHIAIDGVDVRGNPSAARAKVGYLPERVAFPPEMRVREYLNHAAAMKRVARRERKAAVEDALVRIDLTGVAERLITNLSKGYRQRVGLAQALIGSPMLLILDEPLAGVDPFHVWDFRDVLWDYGRDHTVLLSTHVLPEARVLCERVLVMAAGELVFDGPFIEAEVSGRVTRRWRLGIAGAEPAVLDKLLADGGMETVHSAWTGSSANLVVDVADHDAVNTLVGQILDKGWSIAHLEPMTDLIGVMFDDAGLAPESPAAPC